MAKAKRNCECEDTNCYYMLPSNPSNPFRLEAEVAYLVDEFVEVVGRKCVSIFDLAVNSSQKVKWRCQNCYHEWITSLGTRVSKVSRCSNCVPVEESLAFVRPDIAKEIVLNYTNPGRSPKFIAANSQDRIKLRCSACSHEWDSKVINQNRVLGIRCPQCRLKPPKEKIRIECSCGKECFSPILKPAKTLEESVKFLFPRLDAELHPTKNGCFDLKNITPGSSYKLWWLCKKCSYEWPAYVSNRTRLGSGCPNCSHSRISESIRGRIRRPSIGNSLAERYPETAKNWHPTKNSISAHEVGAGSESSFWWLCENGHESYGPPNAKVQGHKTAKFFPCKDCGFTRRSTPTPGHSFGDVFPDVAALWHPTKNEGRTPFDFKPHANEYAWWLCESGHSTEALINSRAAGFTCGECAIGQKSKIEDMFRRAVVSAGFLEGVPDGNARLDVTVRKRAFALVDIFGMLSGSDQGVVVEYDGEYYHSRETQRLMDLDKTHALLNAGFKVVRVREHSLPLLGIVDDNFFEFNYHYTSRQQMRLPENIVAAVGKIKDWLQAER